MGRPQRGPLPTIFMGPYRDRVARGAVPNARPGQNPQPILRELLQLVENEAGLILERHNGRLRIRAAILDELKLVVHDVAVRALHGRGFPANANGSRGEGLAGDVLRRCAGH